MSHSLTGWPPEEPTCTSLAGSMLMKDSVVMKDFIPLISHFGWFWTHSEIHLAASCKLCSDPVLLQGFGVVKSGGL